MVILPEPYRFCWDPPLDAVSALMRATWDRPCWEYDEALLRYHIDKPGSARRLSLGVVSADGALVSYQAHVPLDIMLHGQQLPAVFASFLTASPDTRGANVALPVQLQLLEQAQALDIPLYLTMCEVGAMSNLSLKMVGRKFGRPVKKLCVLQYHAAARASVAARAGSPSSRTREYVDADEPALLARLAAARAAVPLRQVHRPEDVSHRFARGENRRTYVCEVDGQIAGLMHVLVLRVLDRARDYLNAYVQDLVIDGLSRECQQSFVNDALAHVATLPIASICIPDNGHSDLSLWKPLGFRLMPRAINLYGMPLRADLESALTGISSFDLDVY